MDNASDKGCRVTPFFDQVLVFRRLMFQQLDLDPAKMYEIDPPVIDRAALQNLKDLFRTIYPKVYTF